MAQINTYELHITVSKPLDIISIDQEHITGDEFYVEFQILDILENEHHTPFVVNLVHKRFFLDRSKFQYEEDVKGYIGSDLETNGLPEPAQYWMLESVSNFIRRLNQPPGVIPIKIYLWQQRNLVEYPYEEDVDMNDASPATESSIQGLEKIRREDEGFDHISKGDCVICIEKLSGLEEVTRMPCSHIYHGDCIAQWLRTSHLCPLCRFPMPRNKDS